MIKVNGEELQWEENFTVEVLLKKKGIDFPKIIVKVNNEIINRDAYPTTLIKKGDNIKIIYLLSGG